MRREDPTHRLSGFRPVAPIRPQLGRHCYVNGGRLRGIILGWVVGNDVIIFQHQYPGVGGAQLINHFVKRESKSGGVRYYIHIRKKGASHTAWRNESVWHPDRIYRGRPFTDHGSWIAADNRDVVACRRMGQHTLTYNDFRPSSGVTFPSLSFFLSLRSSGSQ